MTEMTMDESVKADEEEENWRRAARIFETGLELASREGDEGRQYREDLQAMFQRDLVKKGARRVCDLLAHMLCGAEGHLGMLGGGEGVAQTARDTLLPEYLAVAVRVQASRFVRRLLELGASPAVKHKIYGAPIHGAVGNEDILRQLLANDGVDKDELDHEGNSPLLLAVREGHTPSVELLLTAGVDSGLRVETDLHYYYDDAERTDDWAALDFAASAGRVDLCELLVEGGANVNATSNECSRTPLHAAAGGNQVGAIDALVRLGASVEGDPANSLYTPVEIAASTGSLKAVAALARHGAALNNALHRAVMIDELKVVVALLEAGADPKQTNPDGDTPLHKAVDFWPREEVSRTLLRHGARVDATDGVGLTPLHFAASTSFEHSRGQNAVDFFLEEGGAAGIGWRDQDGATPLHIACEAGNRYAVTTLLRHGADVTAQDYSGNSPLHLAVKCVKVVNLLLSAGADASAVNIEGSTALYLACSYCSRFAATALVEHDSTLVNVRNVHGDTPLHAAAAGAEEEAPLSRLRTPHCKHAPSVADMLLRAGADESIANNDGNTAVDAPIVKYVAYGRSSPSHSTRRVRAVIRRAPADRAWRRRGLLLLCRAFSEKAQLKPEGSRLKRARVSERGGAADDDDGEVWHVANGHKSCTGDLMLFRLFDLPEEGVFRKIICFL